MKSLIRILLALVPTTVCAQQATLSVVLDRNEILIGEQILVTIELTTATADTVLFPLVGDTLVSRVEVVKKDTPDTAFGGAQLEVRTIKQQITITSFDSGYYAVRPLVAVVNGDTVFSNAFLVSVGTVRIDTAVEIKDLRKQAEAPFSIVEWLMENWPWLAGGAGALAAIAAVVILLMRKPNQVASTPLPPPLPPRQVAFERLEQLRQRKLWQAGDLKGYYSELSDVLRAYIEAELGFPAMELTTHEIVRAAERNGVEATQVMALKRLLLLSDLVKFAKEKPTGPECEQHWQVAYDFVNLTSTPPAENHAA